jgi:hypothetical protein
MRIGLSYQLKWSVKRSVDSMGTDSNATYLHQNPYTEAKCGNRSGKNCLGVEYVLRYNTIGQSEMVVSGDKWKSHRMFANTVDPLGMNIPS